MSAGTGPVGRDKVPIWNVPLLRNPNFTGRKRLLTDLRTALTSGQPAALTQAIHGLGGVGKTQLALEYAYRHTRDYTVVWWVRAEEPATLAAGYAGLAGVLDLPQKDAVEQDMVVEAVRRWLEEHTDWLVVFDNAQEPNSLHDFLPRSATGHVLITSRNPSWSVVARPLPVQVFERSESVRFLLDRTNQSDEATADALADALGDLPVALEQAGAYIEETGIPLAVYLELFRSRRSEVWDEEHPPLDYPDTVATTWSLAMEKVRKTSPDASDLLNLCAYLGPDDVPRTLLSEGKGHLSKPLAATVTDALAMNTAIGALRRYALMEVSGDTVSVHRLVQAVVRDRLTEEDRKTWAEAAVRLVNDAFPFDSDDVRTWSVCSRLLPHALSAAGHAEVLKVASQAAGRLLNQAGLYLRVRAEFVEAKAAFERALAIDEATYGPNHPTVAIRVNNLGNVLRDLGDWEGARKHYERALAIDEATYGPNHPNVAIDVNNLGSVLRDLGDLEGARKHYERALAIDEATYGPDHPNVAIYVNNLGDVLQDLGDLEGARKHYERALAIDEATYGSDHPNVAIDVNNLGSVLRALGDLEGARKHFERALRIFREFLGEDHPNTATVRENLAFLLG